MRRVGSGEEWSQGLPSERPKLGSRSSSEEEFAETRQVSLVMRYKSIALIHISLAVFTTRK